MAIECTYPVTCEQVIYGSYESGSEKSVSNHVKFTCRKADGHYTTYVNWQFSGWGIIGLNRLGNSGTQIEFRKGTTDQLECK